jgi:hypothetical protein
VSDCEAKLRLIRDSPFCWQHKETLEIIRDAFDSTNDVSSALAVYLALSESASDFGSDTFTATKALIAHKAGLSVRTVQRLLNGFEQLGIVKIERQFAKQHTGVIRAANTYTLLSLVSLGNHCSTPFGNEAASSISDKTNTNKGKQMITRARALRKSLLPKKNGFFRQVIRIKTSLREITPSGRSSSTGATASRASWTSVGDPNPIHPRRTGFGLGSANKRLIGAIRSARIPQAKLVTCWTASFSPMPKPTS